MPYLEYELQGKMIRTDLSADRQYFIGRDKDCTVSFPESGNLSLRHCVVYFNTAEGFFALADLYSTNGTLLNGRRIGHRDVILHDGDRIRAGSIHLTYHDEAEAEHLAAGKDAFPERAELIPFVGENRSGKSSEFRKGGKTPCGIIRTVLADHGDSAACLLDSPDGRVLVMKIFRNQPAKEGALEELQKICSVPVNSPGIPFSGCGMLENGSLYYLTEYKELAPYSALISILTPVTPEQGLSLIYCATAALHKLCKTGLIHGDLKPSKLFYSPDSTVMVGGCSIAAWRRKFYPESLKRPEQWYASPEYLSGGELTWKSDLYSLGIILFQMITGVLPFRSDSPEELIRMQLEEPLPEPSARNPKCFVSAEVTGLLRRMTMKDPVHRFASVYDFAETVGKINGKIGKISQQNTKTEI